MSSTLCYLDDAGEFWVELKTNDQIRNVAWSVKVNLLKRQLIINCIQSSDVIIFTFVIKLYYMLKD